MKTYKVYLKGEVVVVSIIIPVFNRGPLLARALDSIEKQTFRDFEIIVVDDHSTEDLTSFISGRAFYLKNSGKGVSSARNTGITAARGDFIAFLDSDDEWLPTKLEKQIEFLDKNLEHSIVHANEIWRRNGVEVKQSSYQQKMG
ncbi:glycosyltransferase family 2 protein, partial [bacterium]|nr:glycosyltransferase family 2 protein [bacterium]